MVRPADAPSTAKGIPNGGQEPVSCLPACRLGGMIGAQPGLPILTRPGARPHHRSPNRYHSHPLRPLLEVTLRTGIPAAVDGVSGKYRAKIEPNPGNSRDIPTLCRVGYSFVVPRHG